MRTLKDLAKEALDVQDACNLTGVLHSFARAASDLRELLNAGSDEVARHPITILWADKVAHLTGTQDVGNDKVMRAYTAVYAILADAPRSLAGPA